MRKNNTTELGRLIKNKREELGISQRALAREANMDCAEVSRIESGKRQKPNILYLKGISETLNISLIELMKLAGYSDVEINWSTDFSNKRSTADYQKQIESYEKFYFDVLEDIEIRRKSASEITLKDISEKLKEASRVINKNMEKFDKDKLPKDLF